MAYGVANGSYMQVPGRENEDGFKRNPKLPFWIVLLCDSVFGDISRRVTNFLQRVGMLDRGEGRIRDAISSFSVRLTTSIYIYGGGVAKTGSKVRFEAGILVSFCF